MECFGDEVKPTQSPTVDVYATRALARREWGGKQLSNSDGEQHGTEYAGRVFTHQITLTTDGDNETKASRGCKSTQARKPTRNTREHNQSKQEGGEKRAGGKGFLEVFGRKSEIGEQEYGIWENLRWGFAASAAVR